MYTVDLFLSLWVHKSVYPRLTLCIMEWYVAKLKVIWYYQCTRALPTANDRYSQRTTRSCVPNGRCFHQWFKHGGTYRTWLQSVLQHIQVAGVTLNKEKYEFGRTSIKFLAIGNLINSDGITGDPQKTPAIRGMERPKCVPEL